MSTDTTMAVTVEAITLREADRAIATMCLAFGSDPATRWTYPDPYTYLSNFPRIVRASAGKLLSRAQVTRWAVSEELRSGSRPAFTPTRRRLEP